MPNKIVYTCGGTGGHIYPAIALAQELSDYQSVFLGSVDRIDGDIIRRHGYPFYGIASSRSSINALIFGTLKAMTHLRRIRPKCVVCTGGMITLPVAIAGWLLRIPIVGLEQNRVAGRTNRVIGVVATLTIGAFSKTTGMSQAIPLGNPVRKTFLTDQWVDALTPILAQQSDVILVFGGSQGAKSINRVVLENIPHFAVKHWFVVHIMGDAEYKAMGYSGPIQSLVTPSKKIIGVILPYAESMDVLLRAATVVVCRSGATSIAELIEFRKPAVLIPYPFAKDDHQTDNAAAMVSDGRAISIAESQLSIDTLSASILAAKELSIPEESGSSRVRVATMIRKML